MLFFYFLCHLKKTDVIDQIESAIVTATLDMNTISKRQNKTNPNVHRLLLRETGSPKRFFVVAMNLLHREHFYTLATA